MRGRGWDGADGLGQGSPPLTPVLMSPVHAPPPAPRRQWLDVLNLIDNSGPYGLTGGIFSSDRAAIQDGLDVLRDAAGNLYVRNSTAPRREGNPGRRRLTLCSCLCYLGGGAMTTVHADQRQVDGRAGGPATLWRRARVGHQRQGRLGVVPCAGAASFSFVLGSLFVDARLFWTTRSCAFRLG